MQCLYRRYPALCTDTVTSRLRRTALCLEVAAVPGRGEQSASGAKRIGHKLSNSPACQATLFALRAVSQATIQTRINPSAPGST